MLKKVALVVSLSCAPGFAQADQLLLNVTRELPYFVQDVDPSTLNRTQLGRIYTIIHSSRSHGDKMGLIKSVLGGRNSLRGLFFN